MKLTVFCLADYRAPHLLAIKEGFMLEFGRATLVASALLWLMNVHMTANAMLTGSPTQL